MKFNPDPKKPRPKKKPKVNYKKVYADFFGYSLDDWIQSELSNGCSGPPHHIFAKQMGGKDTFKHKGKVYDVDAIENLIGLTPEEHVIAHDPTHPEHKTKFELWDIHQDKIEAYLRVSKSRMQ